jgi:hypothetical protein
MPPRKSRLPRKSSTTLPFPEMSDVEAPDLTFRTVRTRSLTHGYFQYPGMMVPELASELLSSTLKRQPSTTRILDPFVGSGTTLVESMRLGLSFTGIDVNPLSILLCRAKSIPHFSEALKSHLDILLNEAHSDRCKIIDVHFPNRNKWFARRVAVQLSRLRRAIRRLPTIWARQFFWVAFAETIRTSSNARTSTFKLHIRPEHDLLRRTIDPIKTFAYYANRNLSSLANQHRHLQQVGTVHNARYSADIETLIADVRAPFTTTKLADALITSPPYGDNKSTVSYGQHSYLPLQWIDLEDIGAAADSTCTKSTHEIDHRSLGGSRIVSQKDVNYLCDISPSLSRILDSLRSQPPDRMKRVAAFYRDLEQSLPNILANVKPNAPMIWVVGQRTVGGTPVPMQHILVELLAYHGATHLSTTPRQIPTKRTPSRNSVSNTMSKEFVLSLTNTARLPVRKAS